MPVTSRLSRKLQETLGIEATDDLMDWMHGMEAQRAELRELNEMNAVRFEAVLDARLEARLAGFGSGLRQEMSTGLNKVRQEMNTGLTDVRQEMNTGLNDLRQEMHTGLNDLRQEMNAGFGDVRKEIATLARDMDLKFGRMDGRLGELEARLERRFADLIKWSFLFWIGSVATLIGALAALEQFLH